MARNLRCGKGIGHSDRGESLQLSVTLSLSAAWSRRYLTGVHSQGEGMSPALANAIYTVVLFVVVVGGVVFFLIADCNGRR